MYKSVNISKYMNVYQQINKIYWCWSIALKHCFAIKIQALSKEIILLGAFIYTEVVFGTVDLVKIFYKLHTVTAVIQ